MNKMKKGNEKIDAIFCGVGGQGILLASEIISQVALDAGLDIKKSEVHGMAQRGGSVISHVRIAEKVHSPLIKMGTADVIVSFELIEAARHLDLLKDDGLILVNSQKIIPLTVYLGGTPYPEDPVSLLKEKTSKINEFDALNAAVKAGNKNCVNVVMLGALSNLLSFPKESWEEAIRKRVPAKFLEVNMKAFKAGRDFTATNAKNDAAKTTRV